MQENFQSFASKVYACIGGALLVSALSAWITSCTPLITLATNPIVAIIAVIVELILVFWLSHSWQKIDQTTSLVGLTTYSILNGFLLSYIFLYYELGSIFTCFIASAGFFFLLTLTGRATKMDLSRISTLGLIALIAIMVISVINIFIGSSMLDLILDIAGVIVFAALSIYDHQKIIQLSESHSQDLDKLVVPMALNVYLDFVNIFLRLLSLFGRKKD